MRALPLVLLAGTVAVLVTGSAAATSGGAAAGFALRKLDRFVLLRPIDARQQTSVPFGFRSHWAQPWRAYLDTVPGVRFRDAVGVDFDVRPRDARRAARLLARAGFRRARVEIGWGELRYDRPDRLDDPARYRMILLALKQAGIRPLILLNANDGKPCPARLFDVRLAAPARAGDRSVRLAPGSAGKIVPGRTGLHELGGVRKEASVLFTSVRADGTAALSKPLPVDLAAGPHPVATLRYAPFQRPFLPHGTPNPAFRHTLAGWLGYVSAVVRFARATLGSTDFDLEVWNELSFGSDFLDSDTYYEPHVDVAAGDTHRAILARTVAWIRAPSRGLSRVGVGDGFASQTPFAAGSTSPAGLTAIDKHPYAAARRFPRDAIVNGVVPLDARGRPDGERAADGGYVDRFVPSYTAFLPEYYLTAVQTEFMIRDLSPITTAVYGTRHGRFAHRRGASPPAVWVTEWNLDPADGGVGSHEGPLTRAQRHVQAKAVLRAVVSFVGKGVRAVYLYAAQDDRLGIIAPGRPRTGGETIAAVERLTTPFRHATRIRRRRSLSLLAVGDSAGRVQFRGDGSAAHPPLFDRQVVAFFPFQVGPRRFVVATYVMTRDVAASYRPTRYRFAIGGIVGCRQRLEASDPLTSRHVPVRRLGCGRRLVVELPLTDSPRLLTIAIRGQREAR